MNKIEIQYCDDLLKSWFSPDPAEQFSNPYLAMGNNPIMYKVPDGEWVHLVIGGVIGGTFNLLTNVDMPKIHRIFRASNLSNFGEAYKTGRKSEKEEI